MIALYGCPKGTNTIVQIDDPSVVEDEGAAYPAWFVPAEMDMGPASGVMRMRRVAQSALVGADNSVRITPIVDGSDVSSQSETFVLSVADGITHMAELEPAVQGTRFTARIDVTDYNGSLEFGECDFVFHPRKGHTRGRG